MEELCYLSSLTSPVLSPHSTPQSALAKERRELKEQQQRTLLDAIPKVTELSTLNPPPHSRIIRPADLQLTNAALCFHSRPAKRPATPIAIPLPPPPLLSLN